MKLISLNTWGGIIGNPFFNFIKEKGETTDIFCFQEIYNCIDKNYILGSRNEHFHLKHELLQILPEFHCFYRENIFNFSFNGYQDFPLSSGLAIFIHKKYLKSIVDEGDFMVYGNKQTDWLFETPSPRNLQYLSLKIQGKNVNIFNFHGTWIKNYTKTDHEARDLQTKNILKILNCFNPNESLILAGDFNLNPDTQAIKQIEAHNLENLIKTFQVQTTRTKYYDREDKFADYIFVNNKIEVQNFEVLPEQISDHLALCLSFNLK